MVKESFSSCFGTIRRFSRRNTRLLGFASGGNMLLGGGPTYEVKSICSKEKYWKINLINLIPMWYKLSFIPSLELQSCIIWSIKKEVFEYQKHHCIVIAMLYAQVYTYIPSILPIKLPHFISPTTTNPFTWNWVSKSTFIAL